MCVGGCLGYLVYHMTGDDEKHSGFNFGLIKTQNVFYVMIPVIRPNDNVL